MKGDEMGRTCNTVGQKKNTYKKLVGKFEEIRQFRRRKRRLEDILKQSSGVVLIDLCGLG